MIPVPIDVVGRTVSFRPSASSPRLEGEVIKVGFQWPYPKDKNGMRVLRKQVSILLPDGRTLKMNAEQEDIKRMEMVAENSNHEHIW